MLASILTLRAMREEEAIARDANMIKSRMNDGGELARECKRSGLKCSERSNTFGNARACSNRSSSFVV